MQGGALENGFLGEGPALSALEQLLSEVNLFSPFFACFVPLITMHVPWSNTSARTNPARGVAQGELMPFSRHRLLYAHMFGRVASSNNNVNANSSEK